MPILRAPTGITQKQVNRLYALAQYHFVRSDEVKELLAQLGVEDARDLTPEQYEDLCAVIVSMDPPTEGRIVDGQTGEVYEDDALDPWEAA